MIRVDAGALRTAACNALAAQGVSNEHALRIADTLVETSLRGIDTHGIRLLEIYVRELAGGRSNPCPAFRFENAFPALGVLDADHAPGVVAAIEAMQHAIRLARTNGIGAVVVKHSNHFGAAGHYAALAARENMIGIACSHSDALVAAYNGLAPMNGTNPLAMAAAGEGDDLFLFDMATSQVSFSRVTQYLLAGTPLEPGWAVGAGGGDAHAAGDVHALQPLGGYKGQGLGMLVQILSATLSGMPADHTITPTYDAPWNTKRNIGHLFICLDVSAISPPAEFRSRVSALLREFRASGRREGDVLVPGDKEARARADRLLHGVPLTTAEHAFCRPYLETMTAANAT